MTLTGAGGSRSAPERGVVGAGRLSAAAAQDAAGYARRLPQRLHHLQRRVMGALVRTFGHGSLYKLILVT